MTDTNDYHFITHWRVKSQVEEVAQILQDAPDLARWWPSVYLQVVELESGDAQGVGKVVSLYTKGWLPYTLRWKFRVSQVDWPHSFTLQAWGDFNGRGIWTFVQDGEWVNIRYDWKVQAEKPLLRRLSFLLKPLFSANHRWAMQRGLVSLELELRRRQAENDAQREAVPLPSGPTGLEVMLAPAVIAVVVIGALASWLF